MDVDLEAQLMAKLLDSSNGGRLTGKAILIVENNAYAAAELSALIAGIGACPVGPLTSAAAGLAMLKTIVVDAAVVDCDVPACESLAIGLSARQSPCVWQFSLSQPAAHPSRFDTALAKPVSASEVLSALDLMWSKSAGQRPNR